MDNFILQLNSTLNAVNLSRNESEVEDLKDEIFDDLEEEALQAEEQKYSNEIYSKSKKTTYYSDTKEDQSESDDDENVVVSRPSRTNQPQINTLGATNHMHNRIFSLEKYIFNIYLKFSSFFLMNDQFFKIK
jgi:hypothetical protein